MPILKVRDHEYEVDHGGFLLDHGRWDEIFAEGVAPEVGISGGLKREHWDVIRFIREYFEKTGKCPLVYETCQALEIHLKDLKERFPAGYLRGACRSAGLTYKEGYLPYSWIHQAVQETDATLGEKVYRVDVRGFLVDSGEWDEYFATHLAYTLKMREGLTERHWQILHYLRDGYKETGKVPTVFDACEANGIGIKELESLFPDGYHRGAVKLAGLRVR